MADSGRDELVQRLLEATGAETSGWARLGHERVAPSLLEWGPPIS